MKYFFSHALFLLFVAFAFSLTTVQAQERNCSAMEVLEQQIQEDPQRQNQLDAIEIHTNKYLNKPINNKVNGIITIPVVVHVIYSNASENISDAQILSQIQILNDDFRRTNSDANGNWSQAADTEIEFCMATVDPNGNPTTGITRKSSGTSAWGTDDAMKQSSKGGVDPWNTDDYLNMWICPIGGGILGYAQFPGGSASTDGVVIGPTYFGNTGTATAPFNLGRTTTHEVGHWLNLRHIWGDGNCSADDYVSDTPTSDAANYGCATGHTSCNSTDMVQNYMDYSDDACMNLFTQGQKTRMRALFDAGGFRSALLNSTACGGGGGNGGGTTACNDTEVNITITFDQYPAETSWAIKNALGAVVASGGTYGSQAANSTLSVTECLPNGCYDFVISDTYGDGICCSYGNGSYTVTGGGSTLASGSSFTSSATTNFCLGGPAETCSDGIKNQGETGIDCGGPCAACPTCNDGIQNQGESGVDCGGPCAACPPVETCSDGIQNQGETGVDCGGPCSACSTACNGTEITINLTTDKYPAETSWTITDASGATVASGNGYTAANSNYTATACLPGGCYDFNITDTYGDGICCSYGNGSYTVSGGGSTLASGGSFAASETTNFCVGGPAPTCDDGIQNQGETGVDCGGPCTACCTDVTVSLTTDKYPAETSWTITNASGTTVASGNGYTGSNSNYTSNVCLPNGCYDFNITDTYGDGICCSYGNGSYTVSGGGSTFASGGSFAASETTNFCVGNSAVRLSSHDGTVKEMLDLEMNLFPNPATDVLNVDLKVTEATVGEMMILDLSGKVIQTQSVELDVAQQNIRFNTSKLANGTYFLLVNTGQQQLTEKFVVIH